MKIPTIIPSLSECTDIAVGVRHSLVLTKNGGVYSFGDNSDGQCGLKVERSYTPVLLDFGSAKMSGVWAGDSHSAMMTYKGDVYAWGDVSKIGLNSKSYIPRPVEEVFGRRVTHMGLGGTYSLVVTELN